MTVRLRDANGAELQVSTKEQAQAWVDVGYRVVEPDDTGKSAPAKPAKKAAARRPRK